MATKLPATQRELMEQLVTERWEMVTMDTEVDSQTGIGESTVSEEWDRLTATLSHIASRLAGDGFEGTTDTRTVVDALGETIGDRLCAWAVDHRMANASPLEVAS